VPENLTGTLISSINKSMHTAISLIIFCKLYSVATPGYLKCRRLKNSCSRRRLTPDLQRVSFYSVIEFLHHSSTTELIPFLILCKGILSALSDLLTMREIINIVMAAVACRFMQDRHEDRYLGSKGVAILVGNGPARATIFPL
jgi:hypothetical protein